MKVKEHIFIFVIVFIVFFGGMVLVAYGGYQDKQDRLLKNKLTEITSELRSVYYELEEGQTKDEVELKVLDSLEELKTYAILQVQTVEKVKTFEGLLETVRYSVTLEDLSIMLELNEVQIEVEYLKDEVVSIKRGQGI